MPLSYYILQQNKFLIEVFTTWNPLWSNNDPLTVGHSEMPNKYPTGLIICLLKLFLYI
jgi:hypothetical protein